MSENNIQTVKLGLNISFDIYSDTLKKLSDKQVAILGIKAELEHLETSTELKDTNIRCENLISDITLCNTFYDDDNNPDRSIRIMNELSKILSEKTKCMDFGFNKPYPEEVSYRKEGYEFKYHLIDNKGLYMLDSIIRISN